MRGISKGATDARLRRLRPAGAVVRLRHRRARSRRRVSRSRATSSAAASSTSASSRTSRSRRSRPRPAWVHGKGNPEEWVAVVRPGPRDVRARGRRRDAGAARRSTSPSTSCRSRRASCRGRVLLMKGVRREGPARERSRRRAAQHACASCEEDLFKHRLKQNTNQLENTMLIRNTRRDIARVKTVLAERVRAAGAAAAARRPTTSEAAPAKKTKRAPKKQTPGDRRPNVAGHKIRKRRMIGIVTSDKMNKTARRAWSSAASRDRKYGKYVTSRDEVQGARREERVQDRRSRRDRREPPAVARQALARRRS